MLIFVKCPPEGLNIFIDFSPQPKLKWYSIDSIGNAERLISNGGDYRLARHNQHLTISNVADGKAGKYRCKAENSEGTAEKDGLVTVAGAWKLFLALNCFKKFMTLLFFH